MNSNQSKIQAYRSLLEVAERYPKELENEDIIKSIQRNLKRLEMQERFGIPLVECSNSVYNVERVYDHWSNLMLYGEDLDRTIGWSDDGRQPNNEWLFRICFTTGAYIFGDSYPVETFKAFWDELKSFNPKYIDSMNSSMYFAEDNSKAVYEAFWPLFNKYKALVKEENQRKRKEELKAELAKLEESS